MRDPSGITVNAKCANRKVGIFVFTWKRQKLAFVSAHVKTKTTRASGSHFSFSALTCPLGSVSLILQEIVRESAVKQKPQPEAEEFCIYNFE